MLRGPASRREEFGRAGENPARSVTEPAEAEGPEPRVGSVVVDVAGVARRIECLGECTGADVIPVTGDVGNSSEGAAPMDGDGRGEEVHGGVVEDEVLRVSIRQLPDEALGDGHAVGADDRGEARGVGKREFVVEGAGANGARGDGVPEEGVDQRQVLGAGGAVAGGQGLDVGGGVVSGVAGGRLGHRLGVHGPHTRTRSGLVFESGSNMRSLRWVWEGRRNRQGR